MIRVLFLLLFIFPILVSAQKRCSVGTIFINTFSSDFFIQNPVVDSLKVTGYSNNSGWVSVSVYLKTFWQDTSYRYRSLNGSEEYDFGFLGDRYLFEKKYGKIQLSKDDIPVLLGQQYIAPTIHFIIRQDSVRHIIKYYCPDKKDENKEKVFTKVEVLVRYKSGIKQLQYEMESAFKKNNLN